MNDELKQALRECFDSGEDLTPELQRRVDASREAAAYWQRLKSLDAALWSQGLEAPPPDLVSRLHREIARDRETRVWRRAGLLAVAVALVVVSVLAGWRYPEYASPDAWWYQVSEYFPEQPWLEQTLPIQTHAAAAWGTISRAWDYAPDYPLTITLSALALSVLLFVVFNAAGARMLRIAGDAGGRDLSHHV